MIFLFFKIFLISKNNFQNFKNAFLNLILCGMPRQRYMEEVAQSATATWQEPCHFSILVGPGTFFKQKKNCKDVFQFFFAGTKIKARPTYMEENHI